MAGDTRIVVQRGEQGEPGVRTVGHRGGDGVVQCDHRVVGVDTAQRCVEREDLRPVGVLRPRGLVMHGGDRRLQLIRADRPRSSAAETSATPSSLNIG